ncbi:MAG: hypothetical protein GC186_15040 [Rhodobacteraceae bacterium]|nr:hypothetical protein [Paracoccaceae bacterium]
MRLLQWGVLVSMLVFGRLWCGLLRPEGALSEAAATAGAGDPALARLAFHRLRDDTLTPPPRPRPPNGAMAQKGPKTSSVSARVSAHTEPLILLGLRRQDRRGPVLATWRRRRMRGSLSIWFDPQTQWLAAPTGKHGRQPTFADAAIHTCLS